jgi:hypothetical protein
MTVAAYRPTAGSAAAVTVSAQALNASGGIALTTPTVDVTEPGSWLVSYWGVKASDAVAFTTPADQQVRADSTAGATSGRIHSRLTDSGAPVTVGPGGGLTASTGGSPSRAAMFSIVLTAQ